MYDSRTLAHYLAKKRKGPVFELIYIDNVRHRKWLRYEWVFHVTWFLQSQPQFVVSVFVNSTTGFASVSSLLTNCSAGDMNGFPRSNYWQHCSILWLSYLSILETTTRFSRHCNDKQKTPRLCIPTWTMLKLFHRSGWRCHVRRSYS